MHDNFATADFSYSEEQIAELISEFTDSHVREAVELAFLPVILKDTTYFIDVGANVGQYIFHAAKHLHNAKLLAIEANPYLIPVLTRTIESLRSHDNQGNEYEVHAIAISDAAGVFEFYVSKFPTLSSVFPHEAAEMVEVKAVRLDDFYRPSGPAVIKIDVEGAEYRVVRSATRFLKSDDIYFFVELHGWGDKTIGKYPIHVCWLFLVNGYASRKIGTHYLFYKAAFLKRVTSFLRQCPYLGVKYVVYRLGFKPTLDKLRNMN